MTVGDRLRAFAVARFGSLEAMAREMGTSGTQVGRWTNDQSQMKAETLTWLSEQGCSLDWLLRGVGPMVVNAAAMLRGEAGEALVMLNGRDADDVKLYDLTTAEGVMAFLAERLERLQRRTDRELGELRQVLETMRSERHR